MALSNEQIEQALVLITEADKNREDGKKAKTNSDIAGQVLGNRKAESTIRRIRKEFYKSNNYRGITLEQGVTSVPEEVCPFSIEDSKLETLCESEDFNVSNLAKRLRTAQKSNNLLRKIQREVFDDGGDEIPSLEKLLSGMTTKIEKAPSNVLNYAPSTNAIPATLEVLISDIQISKLTRHYNTETCLKAMKQYGKDLLQEIADKSGKFKLERVVLELLGDLLEDHEKHNIQSAISTDAGMSEQIVLVTEALWEHVVLPLANLAVEMEVVCIVGNHGSSTRKGMGSFKEGKYSFDYIIFKSLEKFSNLANLGNVTFNIPEGTFGTTEIYGRNVILEHGYNNNTTEKGMIDQMRKRGAQLKVHPTYWRQGDKHHYMCYGNGEQICNAAWFGVDTEGLEYSGILGFSSVPCQTLVWHTDEKSEGKSTVKDIVNIQVFVDE